jgi:AmmeMemoRadiSam system protein B/AmmeMemoRadiSam system protein A
LSGIRPAAVAGRFYPGDPSALAQQVGSFLAQIDQPAAIPPLLPKAIIAPHAGYVFSGRVAASAYARLARGRGAITRVVVLGPSHFVSFRGFAGSTAEAWQTPLGAVRLGRPAAGTAALSDELDRALASEYSVEVHVPFVQAVLGGVELVPVAVGSATPEAASSLIDSLWGGPETLIVISSDLSHFLGYRPAQEIDCRTTAAIEAFDAGALTSAHACGFVPVSGLLLSAKRRGMTVATLDLANSADVGGTRDRVVGYGAWAFYERQSAVEPVADAALLSAAGPVLIELARASIMHGLAVGAPLVPADSHRLPAAITAPGASFVTLRRHGRLRGCVGTYIASRPLMADVATNAFNAAFRDPRFLPLRHDEFAELDLSLALLTRPSAIASASSEDLLRQLEPGLDGLIVADQEKRALFLPAVWKEIADPRQFLTQLKLKAGFAADHWSPEFKAYRFRCVEVKSEPAGRGR